MADGADSAILFRICTVPAVRDKSHANFKCISGSTVFETALGFVGIAWSESGLTRLCLSQRDRAAVERRLAAGLADALRPPIPQSGRRSTLGRDLIDAIKAYAAGKRIDYSAVPVDLAGVDDFRRAIYAAAQRLKFGETTTYGELAVSAGYPGLARETGQALGSNPVPLVIPCHRILAAGGKIGGFSAPGGSSTKVKMLALEGVRVGPPPAPQQSFGF